MKKLILFLLGIMSALPSFGYDFSYTYEGQELKYTVISEAEKTCMLKEGGIYYSHTYAGNYDIRGSLTIPEIAKDGETEYYVTSIGTLSFYDCSGLTSMKIPGTVTSIGNDAFKGCTSIKELVIEDGETPLGLGYQNRTGYDLKNGLFYDCPLETLYIGRNLSYAPYFTYSQNYVTQTGVMSPFSWIETLKNITIGNLVTDMGTAAFCGCSSLPSITIPNSVTAINNDVFYGCSSLTSITIPNSITSIGEDAFYYCSGLTSFEIPNSVTSIGRSAFNGCTSLNELIIEDGESTIDLCRFSDCPLETLYLGRNYNYYYSEDPFSYIKDLVQLTIGSHVTSIKHYAFKGCSSLKSVIILSSNLNVVGDPFEGINLVSYWGSVKPFSGDNYNGNDFSAEKVFWLSNTEPEYKGTKVTYVSTSNVSTDENLKRFDYLSSYFTADNGLRYIPISPQNRTAMLVDFDYALNPESLTIPDKVTYKGIEMDVIQAGNYCCSHIDALQHVDIETKLPEIPDGFFYQCKSLKDFVVDRHPTRIGKSAFEGCTSLADFIMLDWTTDVNVDVNAFNNCGLKNIRIGRQLLYPDTEADSPFANNSTLESVWITDIPSSIGAYMFKGCRNLKDVNVGDRVMSINDYAFAGCSSISRFCFGRSVKSIGLEAFSDCTGMKNLYAEPVSPPICESQALDDINRWECTLHVKSQSKEAYGSAPQWKEFLFVDYGFGLSLNVTSMVMEVGETFQLKVVNNSSSGEVTWKSTNEEILTVSDSGFVTAVGSGSASVAAVNSEGLMDNCSIEVVDNAGIKDNFMNEDTFDGHYRVYSIQGILIMDTTEKSLISSLRPGLYIINGKKFLIK